MEQRLRALGVTHYRHIKNIVDTWDANSRGVFTYPSAQNYAQARESERFPRHFNALEIQFLKEFLAGKDLKRRCWRDLREHKPHRCKMYAQILRRYYDNSNSLSQIAEDLFGVVEPRWPYREHQEPLFSERIIAEMLPHARAQNYSGHAIMGMH